MKTWMPRALQASRTQGRTVRSRLRLSATVLPTVIATSLCLPAYAISGGTSPAGTPQNQSTVLLGCTGTLVAPDLVVTAGHCIPHWEARANAPHAPFRGPNHNDWERPDRFYPTSLFPSGAGPIITVAADGAFTQGDPDEFQTTATHFALPGDADLAVLRVAPPVPRQAAIPVGIMTELPQPVATATTWLGSTQRQFQVAGYSTGNLRTATVGQAQFPCAGATSYKICEQISSPAGATMQGGDSGGPLYLTDTSLGRRLAGMLQSGPQPTHAAAFYRGGANTNRDDLPNLGGWLEQFATGRTGGAAFFFTNSSGEPVIAAGYAANPSGLQPRVEHPATGSYQVWFDRLVNTHQPRIELVTSMSFARHCKPANVGGLPDRVDVRCFDNAGSPADATFSLISDYTSERDLWILAPLVQSGTATVPTIHGDVTVRRLATGSFQVEAPGWRGGAWKNVLVAAEGNGAARCHVQSWLSSTAQVRCLRGSTPTDSGFSFVATAGNDSSYAYADEPSMTSYTADPNYANTAGRTTTPTIRRSSTGQYRVSFPGLPANTGGNAQATAYGTTSNRCTVDSWGPDFAGVSCYTPGGAPADTRFVVRYIDPLDVGRTVNVDLHELIGKPSTTTGCPSCSVDTDGQLDMYGDIRFTAGASATVNIPRDNNARNRLFSPPLTLTARSQPGQQFVDVVLRVRDDDGSSSPVDRVDIVPNPNVTDLRFRIDLVAHQIRMLDSLRPILGGLGTWWSDGMDGGGQTQTETARAVLKVRVNDH